MSQNDLLLSMKKIRKAFPGVLALDEVDFELGRGEIHALIGENGAGKSTLIKILAGVHRKDKGEIILDGERIEINNPHHAQTLGIHTIFQEISTVPNLSIAENMFLGREIRRMGLIDHRAQIERTNKLLEDFNYCMDPRTPAGELNVAERRMINIVKAIDNEVKILILDEPTASLTDRERDILFENLRRLRGAGAGIIYISHRMEELKDIVDRVTVLRNGSYIDTLEMEDVHSIDDLVPLMIGREIDSKFPKVKAEVGEPLLRIKNLTRKGAFNDVNLEVRAGEVVGFFGLVGCGFGEVFRSVFGASPYDSGSVEAKSDGEFKPVRKHSPKAALDLKISYIPRDRKHEGLVMPMSIKENVALSSFRQFAGLAPGSINYRKVDESVCRFSDMMAIKAPNLECRVETLSGGNQQKVVMAKALCRGGDIFIFCEPTAGIDVGSKVEIYQFINKLTAEGAGIVLVSYELPEVLGMSDRIMVMYDGRIVREFTREEADEEEILKYAFGHGEPDGVVESSQYCEAKVK